MMPPEAFPGATPYIGPRPFERGETRLFFGRHREALEIASLVIAHPEVVLHAPSGAGKTSLLNAGVIPRLEDEFGCEVLPSARMLGSTGGMPPEAIRNIFSFAALVSRADEDAEPDRLTGTTLRDYLRDREHRVDEYGEAAVRVAIFDHFEEVFTAHSGRRRDRRDFFEEIRASFDDDPMLREVFSIREDRIAELEPHASLRPGKLRLRYRLEPPRRDSALEAIVLPLRATGRQFSAGVAERIIDDLMTIHVSAGEANAMGGSPGEEPVDDGPGMSFPPGAVKVLGEFGEPLQ